MLSRARVLVADDDLQLLDAVSEAFTQLGADVVGASSGADLIEQLATAGPFDLVVTDIIMPELDGIEAIRRIRDDYPDLRIVAMSGGGQIDKADFLHMAEILGADRVIEKPVRSEKLLQLVSDALAEPARKMPGAQ